MRIKSKIGNSFLIAITLISLISCNPSDDGVPPASNTIAELVAGSPNLTILQSALERAGMESSLQASGSLTLLAPTDAAFNVFLANANFASIDDVPVPDLEQLLLNHVLGARIDESLFRAIQKNYTETFANGPAANTHLALYFDATGATITFNGASDVVDSDIAATNGIIHVVDAVVDLPTISTFVQSNEAFEQLTVALTTATPGTNFMAMLSGTTNFTLFAPPDAAIDDLLETDPSWNSVNDIDEEYLTAVLQHHVITGNVRSSNITNDQTIASLEGDLLTFSTSDGDLTITDGSGIESITVVIADIQAINGVFHIIERVLLPDTSN
jgi:uncharacterized surface protein with fasciclin (FAS1) repeats